MLGLLIRAIKIWLDWKKTKAQNELIKTSLDQNKPLPETHFDDLSTQEKRRHKTRKRIYWLFGKKFGKETESDLHDTAWNPAVANRRMLAHTLVWTVCSISIIWAIFPKVTIHTLNYGDDPRISLLFGLVSWPLSPGIIEVSTGSIVFGLLHLLTFIITCYFVQRD